MSFWARRRRVFAAAAFALATTGMVAYLWTGGEDGSGTSKEGKVSTNIRYTEKKQHSNDSSFPIFKAEGLRPKLLEPPPTPPSLCW